MGLVCGTPTRFMPADAADARTAQATTITPALGAGVKNYLFIVIPKTHLYKLFCRLYYIDQYVNQTLF